MVGAVLIFLQVLEYHIKYIKQITSKKVNRRLYILKESIVL